ncbi:hypothetical protein F5Y19DRAFT_425553 [Xylariaceae sp. FL1651]|nr:hypothetical protein F5Y19DRAFT_425553 [Xylariaceae sp. FL1651]
MSLSKLFFLLFSQSILTALAPVQWPFLYTRSPVNSCTYAYRASRRALCSSPPSRYDAPLLISSTTARVQLGTRGKQPRVGIIFSRALHLVSGINTLKKRTSARKPRYCCTSLSNPLATLQWADEARAQLQSTTTNRK